MQSERADRTSTATPRTPFSRAEDRAAFVPESVHAALGRSGRPLPANDRAAMEAHLGHDFANVRIYDDAAAARSADDIGAAAYSFGNKLVFGNGVYRPGDRRGSAVLAHELAHVVQQPTVASSPHGIARPDAPAEREARANASALGAGRSPALTSGSAAPGLIHRQAKDAPLPAPPPPPPQTTAQTGTTTTAPNPAAKQPPPQPADPQAVQKPADLRTRVRAWLDQSQFSLPLVADSAQTRDGARRAFYGQNITTLDAIADDLTDVLGQTMEGVFVHEKRTAKWTDLRVDVWTQLWPYYNEKKAEAEKDRWQTVIQVLYTPQITLYSNPTGAVPAAQHNLQIGGGRNLRFHPAGEGGFELQGLANVSLFSLGSGHTDAFQNALVGIQAQHVWNLGHEFRIAPDTWATLQASAFVQLAAGVGGSYADNAQGDRKLYVGFLAQPSAGGQINLNVGWFQVIASGSTVFSYLSPTTQPGSTSTKSAAVQFGLGVGAQF